jgi:KaiC/GvpD/RAD55 family RecA-like ATPase
MAALGSGRYYGLDQEVADRFSKPGTVKEHTLKLDNVLVITSDEDMENVKKQAEEDTGHDFGKKGNNYNGFLLGDQPARFSKWAKAQGLTALITTYKEAPGGRQVLVF